MAVIRISGIRADLCLSNDTFAHFFHARPAYFLILKDDSTIFTCCANLNNRTLLCIYDRMYEWVFDTDLLLKAPETIDENRSQQLPEARKALLKYLYCPGSGQAIHT